jgi:hypothetical protein
MATGAPQAILAMAQHGAEIGATVDEAVDRFAARLHHHVTQTPEGCISLSTTHSKLGAGTSDERAHYRVRTSALFHQTRRRRPT